MSIWQTAVAAVVTLLARWGLLWSHADDMAIVTGDDAITNTTLY